MQTHIYRYYLTAISPSWPDRQGASLPTATVNDHPKPMPSAQSGWQPHPLRCYCRVPAKPAQHKQPHKQTHQSSNIDHSLSNVAVPKSVAFPRHDIDTLTSQAEVQNNSIQHRMRSFITAPSNVRPTCSKETSSHEVANTCLAPHPSCHFALDASLILIQD